MKKSIFNYFEKEYLPGKKNTLVKIIDESLDGKEKYGNLFPDECLDVLQNNNLSKVISMSSGINTTTSM